MTELHKLPPSIWIPVCLTAFMMLIINIAILKNERSKRQSKQTQVLFPTKYLQIWSIACIISGASYTFFFFTLYFPGFCYFSAQLQSASIGTQIAFMGFYQLSRLNYCFAQTKVYSKKGYPNYVFITMYIIGFISSFILILQPWFILPAKCGVNSKYDHYFAYYHIDGGPIFQIVGGSALFVYLLWDGIILLLYIVKVISFRKYKSENIDIYKRIMSILNRIFLLTVLYEIMVVIILISVVIYVVTNKDIIGELWEMEIILGLMSIIFSYSMFLMQEHNTNEYINMLEKLYRLKIHYLCCCGCKSIIIYEIGTHSQQQTEIVHVTANEDKPVDMESTAASGQFKKLEMNAMEFSIPTVDSTKL